MILRQQLKDFLEIEISLEPVEYKVLEQENFEDFERQLIQYAGSEQDEIKAYLFIPVKKAIRGAVLVHHQHNGDRHLGKSEVSGLIGDENQFFCPALAQNGIIALAPDSISFEERRTNRQGTQPAADPDEDILQHFNEMCYRLLNGTTLMKKVIEDSSIAISLLSHHKKVQNKKIGILGHSYGGNTVIFHSPLDERILLSCSSGAVCSYQTKIKHDTGIEMAEVIPGFIEKYDIEDLLECNSPRKLLILSASQDIYSQDATEVVQAIKPTYEKADAGNNLIHYRYEGGHALDEGRFRDIIEWFDREMEE
ncbi:MAG: hypothetical protein DHS20C18_48770 [Saprospiraceae bacterium]|nr:MAG: hypothetical protein DHS20C18_48770 [Saprospiraceae bacterium]